MEKRKAKPEQVELLKHWYKPTKKGEQARKLLAGEDDNYVEEAA